MSYFDDNEDRIIYGSRRQLNSPKAKAIREKIARAALAAPPGSDLAKARIEAHAAFDPFWQSGRFNRNEAYEWLASELGIPKAKCHMVLFDIAQCRRVVAICMAHPKRHECLAADFDRLD